MDHNQNHRNGHEQSLVSTLRVSTTIGTVVMYILVSTMLVLWMMGSTITSSLVVMVVGEHQPSCVLPPYCGAGPPPLWCMHQFR